MAIDTGWVRAHGWVQGHRLDAVARLRRAPADRPASGSASLCTTYSFLLPVRTFVIAKVASAGCRFRGLILAVLATAVFTEAGPAELGACRKEPGESVVQGCA